MTSRSHVARKSRAFTVPVVVALALFAGCLEQEGGVLPPPADGTPARIRHPQSLALAPNGATLYVAHSGRDYQFNAGVVTAVPVAAFDGLDGARVRLRDVSGTTYGLIEYFPGRLVVNTAGDAAYLPAQDAGRLQRVRLDVSTGAIACAGAPPDCRTGAVELASRDLGNPFALTRATATVPGGTGPEAVLLLSHLAPTATPNGTTTSVGVGFDVRPAKLAVIPERLMAAGASDPFDPSLPGAAYTVDIGTTGSNSLAVGLENRLWIGGCFERETAERTDLCSLSSGAGRFLRSHLLRSIALGSGPLVSAENVSLAPFSGGGDTRDLAVSGGGRFLHVATTGPSLLLTLDTATIENGRPSLVSAIPMPTSASSLIVLPRAGGDLVVVASSESDTVLVADPFAGRVVAQLPAIGNGPGDLAFIRRAGADRVFVSLFYACAVLAIDVPHDDPSLARVVGGIQESPCP